MQNLKTFVANLIAVLFGLLGCLGVAVGDEPTGAPSVFVVLVDVSGSMDDPFPAPVQTRLRDKTKLDDVKRRLALLSEHLPERTRVIAYTFDHRVTKIFDETLQSLAEREKLAGAFQQIQTNNGSTFLWRTLDTGLDEAKQLLSQQHSRARVLLYSDGKDEEKKFDQHTIIAKYGDFLRDNVQLDFMCIGYDLAAEVKQPLLDAGVRFTRADVPEKLDVVVAAFLLEHASGEVGRPVSAIDQSYSTGQIQTTIDWGDGSNPQPLIGSSRHTFNKPGQFNVVVQVIGDHAQDRCSRIFEVKPPAVVPAKLELVQTEFSVGERLVAKDVSNSATQTVRWLLDKQVIAEGPVLSQVVDSVGKQVLVLERVDEYRRTSTDQAEIVVTPNPLQAAFRVAGEHWTVGQKILAINESSPQAKAFEWLANGKEISREQHLEWMPTQDGEVELELRVSDAWKQTERATRMLTIQSAAKPQAKIVEPGVIIAGQPIAFTHVSTGPIEGCAWALNGKILGDQPATVWSSTPGDYELVLEVWGGGLRDRASHSFTVPRPEPPTAQFRAPVKSPTCQTPVVLLNESSDSAVSFQWTVNDKLASTDRHLEWTPLEPGKYRLEMTCADRWEQVDSTDMLIEVLALAKPSMSIIAPDVVEAGAGIAAVCNVVGEHDRESLAWKLNDAPLSDKEPSLKIESLAAGEHELTAEVISPGGPVSTQHRFKVLPFASPVAGLALSSDTPFVGDVIRILDQSSGAIDSIRLSMQTGNEPAKIIDIDPTKSKSLDWKCETQGPLQIHQLVTGPGGTAESVTNVTVTSRIMPPRAKFETEEKWHRGCLELLIINHCEGDVKVLEFDPGDGSPVRRLSVGEPIEHRYGPGEFRATIAAISNESSFAPSVWTSPRYHVPTPWPTWLITSLWLTPLLAVVAVGGWIALQTWRAETMDDQVATLNGVLQIHPVGCPLDAQSISFDGKSVEEIVKLDPKTDLRLTCIDEGQEGEIVLELLVDGISQATRTYYPGGNSTIGDYEFSFSTAPFMLA